MTPDFDAPQEGTPTPADVSGGEPTLPDARVTSDPVPAADVPENLLDQNLDETNVEDALRQRVTISTLASMASLDVVIPGGGMLAGLYDTLFRSREMNDDFSISNLGGTLEEYFRFQQGELDAEGKPIHADGDDDDDFVEAMKSAQERQEQVQQELREWAESEHSLGGVEMTGEQWGQLAEDISPNGKMRQWLIQRFMKNGKTQAQAEQEADEMSELYRIEAKPETQRTADEKAKLDKAKQNPEFRATTQALKKERDSNFGAANDVERTTTRATQTTSTFTRADAFAVDSPVDTSQVEMLSRMQALPPAQWTEDMRLLDREMKAQPEMASELNGYIRTTSRQNVELPGSINGTRNENAPATSRASTETGSGDLFASAPDLTEHHQAALAATVPLDAPKPQLAAVAAAPAPGSGFDV